MIVIRPYRELVQMWHGWMKAHPADIPALSIAELVDRNYICDADYVVWLKSQHEGHRREEETAARVQALDDAVDDALDDAKEKRRLELLMVEWSERISLGMDPDSDPGDNPVFAAAHCRPVSPALGSGDGCIIYKRKSE